MQELVSSRNRALLCLARTLDNKREVAMGVEAVVQLMVSGCRQHAVQPNRLCYCHFAELGMLLHKSSLM